MSFSCYFKGLHVFISHIDQRWYTNCSQGKCRWTVLFLLTQGHSQCDWLRTHVYKRLWKTQLNHWNNRKITFFACYTLYIYCPPCISKSILYIRPICLQYDKIYGGIWITDYLLSMCEINAAKSLIKTGKWRFLHVTPYIFNTQPVYWNWFCML